MRFAERIETARLLLRKPLFPDDAASIHVAYASDPEVARFDSWRAHTDVAETLRLVWQRVGEWETGMTFSWVVTDRASGEVLGMVSLYPDATYWRVRLGYLLARTVWGKGVATEAVRAVVETALTDPQIRRVWAVVDVENTRSVRVLEKVGLQREGRLGRWSVHPGQDTAPRDCWCYALTR